MQFNNFVPHKIGLFDNIAVYLKQKKEVQLATRNVVEFKKPVSLFKQAKYPNLNLAVNFYVKNDAGYIYDVAKVNSGAVSLNSVIIKVKLILKENGKFFLNANDARSLNEFEENISKKNNQKPSRRVHSAAPLQKKVLNSVVSTEGRVVLVSNNEPNKDDSCRRQQRIVMYKAE